MRSIALAICFAALSTAQVYNPGKDIVDAYQRGASLRLEQERLELEKQRLDMERAHGPTHRDLETLRGRTLIENASSDLAINNALRTVSAKFPDFSTYAQEMDHMMSLFAPGKSADLTTEKYLEGLYLISKYASFSGSRRSSTPSAARVTRNEDIIALVQEGISDDLIIKIVKGSGAAYDLGPHTIIALKEASHVSEAVIGAMIEASKN